MGLVDIRTAIEDLCHLTKCRCGPTWTERRLHHPDCRWDYREDVLAVQARIEDLEEALRRIVVVISPDGRHECERADAVLAIALDQLNLDRL